MTEFDTRCPQLVSTEPNTRTKHSPSPHITLINSQSTPLPTPSSAMSTMNNDSQPEPESNDLAGLAHSKNSLTLHYFLT